MRITSKEYVVTLKVKDNDGGINFRPYGIIIKPKYRFQYYRLYVGLKHSCDPYWDSGKVEFSIIQTVDGVITNEWDWEPSNNFFFAKPFTVLEGSQTVHEFEVTEPYPIAPPTQIPVVFTFTDKDKWYDDVVTIGYSIRLYNPSITDEEFFSYHTEKTAVGDGCEIMYAVDSELKLLVPLPKNPNVNFIIA